MTLKYVEKLENVNVMIKKRRIIEYEYKTETTQKHNYEKFDMLKGQIPL